MSPLTYAQTRISSPQPPHSATSVTSGKLWVRNSLTLHRSRLGIADVRASTLVKAAPELEIPDRI